MLDALKKSSHIPTGPGVHKDCFDPFMSTGTFYSFLLNYPKAFNIRGHGDTMKRNSQEIAVIGLFIALIAVLQVSPLYVPTAWGMRIDIVAVPVLVAFFLYGLRTALAVSAGMFVVLSIVAAESVIGASMKWIATVPMVITPAILRLQVSKESLRNDIGTIVGAVISIVALIALVGIMYEMAGSESRELYSPFIVLIASAAFYGAFYIVSQRHEPQSLGIYKEPKMIATVLILAVLVRGITTTVINYYFTLPVFFDIPTAAALEWVPWYVMFGLNAIQGALEVTVAWLLVFKTKAFSYVQKAYIQS